VAHTLGLSLARGCFYVGGFPSSDDRSMCLAMLLLLFQKLAVFSNLSDLFQI
jgi:hypothetical protein